MTLSILWMILLAADPILAGDHTRSLEVGGRTRTYLVHVPRSYDGSKPFPVVLTFHGGASNARQMVHFCGLNEKEKADAAGFIVVYPNGTGRQEKAVSWNGGNCCGYAKLYNVDDVGFVRTLLDDLGRALKVDQKRIYATGISNGGIMAYRLASELSDHIAAIAPVSGPMGTATCNPKRPVSVMHFHGTDDDFAPFNGGKGKKSLSSINFYSVDHSIRNWVKANGCPETPKIDKLPDTAKDGTSIVRKTYEPGNDGSEVVLITIEGGGHTWPGREPRLRFLGKSTKNISANDLMWDFFQKHPRR